MKNKVLILGSTGLVGSNLYKKYREKYQDSHLLTPKRYTLDLEDRSQVIGYFIKNKPDVVFMCAAKVGGIKANNDYKADFITSNLKIQTNVIEACHLSDVKKFVFNLYGPGDNFDLNTSHVLPALIRKFHEAKENNLKEVEVWGTGKPMREFMYAEDLSEALIYLSENYSSPEIINVGTGEDVTISDLCNIISDVVGYKGEIRFNTDYPDGTYRKVMDVTRIFETGWRPSHTIEEGIKKTYEYYKNTICRLEKQL